MEKVFPLFNDGRRCTHHAAAALASLGMAIKTERIHDYRTQAEGRTFFFVGIAPGSLMALDESLQYSSKQPGAAAHILHLYQTGDLAQLDPYHPFLDALRALANYEQIKVALAGRVSGLGLTPDPDAPADRFRAAPGSTPISTPSARTSDPHKAAALLTLGAPLLAIHGQRMTFGAPSSPLPTPSSLLQSFRDGSILVNHPFCTGWNACRFLDALDLHLGTETGTLSISRTGHGHRALVSTTATGGAMDRAIRFSATGR